MGAHTTANEKLIDWKDLFWQYSLHIPKKNTEQTQVKSSIVSCFRSQDFGLPIGQSTRSTQALVVLQFAFDQQVCAGLGCVFACANCEGHLEGCGAPGRAATWLLVCEVIAPRTGYHHCQSCAGQVTYTLWGNGGGHWLAAPAAATGRDHPPDRGHLTCHPQLHQSLLT